MRQPDRAERAATGGRRRLEPDPRVRVAILTGASEIVRKDGVGALSIAAVLGRARLSTRAFYRHFDSKDQLVSALFLETARAEMRRLGPAMAAAVDPVRAVVAWIDGRLDLACDDQVGSDLRRLSLEAHSQMFVAPELVGPAYDEILRPLVEQLQAGRDQGSFGEIDPLDEAVSIHGVVWSNIERQWAGADPDSSALRVRVQRFCLRGLGVAPEAIDRILFVDNIIE
ncbi:MAG: TetR/AcrR family transcriptional regulator [Mycobacterium sp.]